MYSPLQLVKDLEKETNLKVTRIIVQSGMHCVYLGGMSLCRLLLACRCILCVTDGLHLVLSRPSVEMCDQIGALVFLTLCVMIRLVREVSRREDVFPSSPYSIPMGKACIAKYGMDQFEYIPDDGEFSFLDRHCHMYCAALDACASTWISSVTPNFINHRRFS